MRSVLKRLNYSNWEQLASQVAEEIFPEGTLVNWGYAGGLHFGIVKGISDTGKITIQRGELPLKKVTDNKNTGGTYAKFWYVSDIDKFQQYSKDSPEIKYAMETPRTRFNPRCYRGDDWEKHYSSPIEWTQTRGNRMLILGKPKIEKNGLIVHEHYCD